MSSSDTSGITQSLENLSIATTAAAQATEERPEDQLNISQDPLLLCKEPNDNITQENPGRSTDTITSGSDTEREENSNMPSGSSSKKHHSSSSSSSKKHHSSSSSSKHHSKSDDWSDVTEPEERRRIQNRIAQRKFRKYMPMALSHITILSGGPLPVILGSHLSPLKKSFYLTLRLTLFQNRRKGPRAKGAPRTRSTQPRNGWCFLRCPPRLRPRLRGPTLRSPLGRAQHPAHGTPGPRKCQPTGKSAWRLTTAILRPAAVVW